MTFGVVQLTQQAAQCTIIIQKIAQNSVEYVEHENGGPAEVSLSYFYYFRNIFAINISL